MDLIERFRYLIKIKQLTAASFADEIGVQRSSVSHVLSGRNKPSMEFIQKILIRFPKVDAAWLISGAKDGQMPLQLSDEIEQESEHNSFGEEERKVKLPESTVQNIKKIWKIVVFYDDNTFEEFHKS